jgi:hypothetical protein
MGMVKSVMRMPAITSLPARENLKDMSTTAQRNKSLVMLLPWTNETTQRLYLLTCTFDLSNEVSLKKKDQDMIGEPIWTLHSGIETSGPVIWSHTTGDLDLVINFMQMEISKDNYRNGLEKEGGNGSFDKHSANPSHQVDQSNIITKTMTGTALAGDLKDMEIGSVLKSIKVAKMNGLLDLATTTLCAQVYFHGGEPVHADLQKTFSEDDSSTTGDRAFLELLTWESGSFKFHRGRTTTLRTITRQLDELCKAASCLQDYDKQLKEAGLTTESYLWRTSPNLTDEEFAEMFKDASSSYINVVRTFYSQVDNATSLYEILNRTAITRTTWVPILHKLLKLNLIKIEKKAGERSVSLTKAESAAATSLLTKSVKVDMPAELYQRVKRIMSQNPNLDESAVICQALALYLDEWDRLAAR